MHTQLRRIAATLLGIAAVVSVALVKGGEPPAATPHRPELEYLEAVNRHSPPSDTQLLFLLMGQYASAQQHAEGAGFFAERLKEFGPRLSDPQKALYLSAIAALRAGHAAHVPLLAPDRLG